MDTRPRIDTIRDEDAFDLAGEHGLHVLESLVPAGAACFWSCAIGFSAYLGVFYETSEISGQEGVIWLIGGPT